MLAGAFAGLAGLFAVGCGGSRECDPECRAGFQCYFGVCAPVGPSDGSGDTGVDVHAGDEAGPPAEDGGIESPEVLDVHETGTCTGPLDCDDGNPCTQDLCDTVTGSCYNPLAVDGTACEDDFDPCTNDVCLGGYCAHEPTGECCSRDADCMWPGHAWECDAATGTCYDPPEGEFCARCTNRANCGDGGDASDDMCVYYSYTSPGCSKDCIDDLDCPGAGICWLTDGGSVNRPCEPGDSGCLCVARLGSCEPLARFGTGCIVDTMCRTCGTPCNMLICRNGYCTWECGSELDCLWGSTCDGGICVRE
jgi:hypothetical protein